MRRVWRWIRRIVLATAVLVVIAIAIVVIGLHTAFGRELVRARIEAKLAEVVVGGAHLGAVEGSPFGTLVLRDLVLDGPDGLPAITVPPKSAYRRSRRMSPGRWSKIFWPAVRPSTSLPNTMASR